MKDVRILLKNVRPYAGLFALALFLMLLVALFEAGRTALLKSIIDELPSTPRPSLGLSSLVSVRRYLPEGVNALPIIAGLLVLFTIIRGTSEYLSSVLMWRVGVSVVVDLRQRLYDHVLQQSSEFFTDHPTNELTTHIISDADKVQTSVSTLLADILREGLTFISLLALVFVLNWRLTLGVLVVGPIVFLLTSKFGRKLRRIANSTQEGTEDVLDVAQESISGHRIVKAFGMERFEQRRFRDALIRLAETQVHAARVVYLSSPILELVGVLIAAGFVLYAKSEIEAGMMTIGDFGTYIVAMLAMYDPLRRLSRAQNYFQQSFAASTRIYSLLDTHTEKSDVPGAIELAPLSQSIELRKVSFRYQDTADWILRDVSLEVRRGDVVALVGLSGAGKTTLTNLLMRFYDPSEGKIMIDGVELSAAKLASLRSQIALVTQDVILFNDSVLNNIAYGRPDFDRERIEAAARAAYAHDFIIERGGYDTVIGERGVKLSGGERQRLAIARALLKDAPILILDEATSALDTQSERLVQRALSNLMRGRTTIVIAHRLTTIHRADAIVVLDHGRIVDVGSHTELMSRGGIYRDLYELQFADDVVTEGEIAVAKEE
ncbi:MAG TPA: ABC transporter transmembrane domain-containing protein [Blastocatellia bacterium]|jgi:subfamily B ATP-binding cassette protein MsbA|nr:ABC transporter transmembrane domain-containing protein [Blastocatellia bacterium]